MNGRCGAFGTTTGATCIREADHTGPHVLREPSDVGPHEVVTAFYQRSTQDWEIDVSPEAFRFRALGEKKWEALPWNEVFAYLDAGTTYTRHSEALFGKRGKRK